MLTTDNDNENLVTAIFVAVLLPTKQQTTNLLFQYTR